MATSNRNVEIHQIVHRPLAAGAALFRETPAVIGMGASVSLSGALAVRGRNHASARTDPRGRRRAAENQDVLQCDETKPAGMKPFSGVHEAMVKPSAITNDSLEATGQGGAAQRTTIAERRGDGAMSQIRKGFLGAAAIALTLGAVQLASGHDLANHWQSVSEQPSHIVNRAGKADHLAERKPFAVPTKTVSLRLNDLADTSVLLRIPSAQARTIKAPTLLRNQSRKPTIACEPMVSSLTEVARLLPPGRCVT